MINHPYINYALALLVRNGVAIENISHQNLLEMIDVYHKHVSLKWSSITEGNVLFGYSPDFGGYVKSKTIKEGGSIPSPHVISSDLSKLSSAIENLISLLKQNKKLENKGVVPKSLLPIGGAYLRFSAKRKEKTEVSLNLKAETSLSLLERCLIAIMTLTDEKPCMTIVKKEDKGVSYNNICIIPDLSQEAMVDFIAVFNRLRKSETANLFESKVFKDGKVFSCYPPKIYNGNFPNSVSTPYLSALSILGSIGYLSKKGDVDMKAFNVLNELERCPIYIFFQSGNAEVFTYNHYIIGLAKEGNLKSIIDSLYHIKLFRYPDRKNDKNKKDDKDKDSAYQRLDYNLSRFLILFNDSAFNGFISCRAEYPNSINNLFTKYFDMMNGIDKEVIKSAQIIGGWINSAAFKVAKEEINKEKDWNQFEKEEKEKTIESKYKVLIELENSISSAKEGDSMVRQLFTRIGRLANEDAPAEATIFMDAVFENKIPLSVAKNILIAYSRVRSDRKEKDIVVTEQQSLNQENTEDNSYI